MVEVICTHFDITSGEIEVGCDGLSALRIAFGQGSNFDPDIKDPDCDMLSTIRKALAQSPVKWTWRHVLGHQDDNGIKVLDRWVTLNIEMDNLVKVHWNDLSNDQAENKQMMNHDAYQLKWIVSKLETKVDFMDLTISIQGEWIHVTLYEKPSNLHLYIPSHSCHPPGLLAGVVHGMIFCIYALWSDDNDKHARACELFQQLR
jgi:hypothetical protein